ncbi:MAG: Flp family type IVb pilin [Acidimicrobiia bacterium]
MSKGEQMYARFMRFYLSERGASMVEYALLVLLIAIVALVAVTFAGTSLSSTYSEISSNLVEVGS